MNDFEAKLLTEARINDFLTEAADDRLALEATRGRRTWWRHFADALASATGGTPTARAARTEARPSRADAAASRTDARTAKTPLRGHLPVAR